MSCEARTVDIGISYIGAAEPTLIAVAGLCLGAYRSDAGTDGLAGGAGLAYPSILYGYPSWLSYCSVAIPESRFLGSAFFADLNLLQSGISDVRNTCE